MSSIPLPALSVRPPQQQAGPLDTYSQVLQVKNQQQAGQLGAERLKQEQMQTQAAQRQQAEDQVIQQTIAANGNDIGKALPELSSKISPQRFIGLQKAHREEADAARKRTDEELSTRIKQGDALSGLITQAQQLPPDQYQAQYPQIVAAARQIKPDLKIPDGQVVPQEMLGQLSIGIMAASQIDKQEADRRAAAGEQRAQAEFDAKKAKGTLGGGRQPVPGVDVPLPADVQAQKITIARESRPPQAPAIPPSTSTLTGEEFLKTLPLSLQSQVKAIAEGRSTSPPANSRSETAQQIRAALFQYDPSFSEQRAQLRKAFLGSGPEAKNIGNVNTAIVHLGRLGDTAEALKNGQFTPGNELYNYFKDKFGSQVTTNFGLLKDAVAGEMAAALKGTATDIEIEKMGKSIRAANSPEQMGGVLREGMGILSDKANTYDERYHAQSTPDDPWSPILPRAKATLQKYGVSTASGKQSAPAQERPVYIGGKLAGYTTDGKTMRKP
jgi:hypothetical protein